jgi:hypothetical protein
MARSGRGIARTTLACGVVTLACWPAGAEAACGKAERFSAHEDAGPGPAPLAIGDSVLLGAAEEAAAIGYEVDVRICRPTSEGLALLRKRARRDRLPRLVVIALGANSAFTTRDVRAALRTLGPDRVLGLVTPREVPAMSTGDAKVMRAAARRWPKRITLIDWAKHARDRPKLTYDDGIHLTPRGQRAMARLLGDALPLASPPPPTDAEQEAGETEQGGAEAP